MKPLGLVQYRFESFYVYGAVEPTMGASFFLELPQLNTVNFQILLEVVWDDDRVRLAQAEPPVVSNPCVDDPRPRRIMEVETSGR